MCQERLASSENIFKYIIFYFYDIHTIHGAGMCRSCLINIKRHPMILLQFYTGRLHLVILCTITFKLTTNRRLHIFVPLYRTVPAS